MGGDGRPRLRRAIPSSSSKGDVIIGLAEAAAIDGVEVTHAGTAAADGETVTAGGRVLNVTALGRPPARRASAPTRRPELISFDGHADANRHRRSGGRRVATA